MITKEQVRKGFAKGILNLAANPEMETGTVCTIGDQWFCISDTADRLSPEEYLRTVPMPIAHEEVYNALDGMDKEDGFDDLYSYCAAVLSLADEESGGDHDSGKQQGREYQVTMERTERICYTFHAPDDKTAEKMAAQIYDYAMDNPSWFADGNIDGDYALCDDQDRTLIDWV